MPARQSPFVRFGPFEANLAARELRKNGARLKLQDQPFRVLEALLERPGEVVTREELQERIWGDDTYVDFDKSLSAAVGKVREALGDSRTRPKYVETIPKVGYRFIESLDEAAPMQGTASNSPPLRMILAGAAVVLALLVALGEIVWDRSIRETQAPVIASAPVQLTAYPGEERQPTFSPDGNQVAFTRREAGRDDYDIWVTLVGEEEALQLTSTPADEMSPAWSPDGSQIAFLKHRPNGLADVMLISPHGSGERRLTELRSHPGLPATLDWSPDGSLLVTYQREYKDTPGGLYEISASTGDRSCLIEVFGTRPSFSLDGTTIAFLKGSMSSELFLTDANGGNARRIASLRASLGRPVGWSPLTWTPDGRGLLFGRPLSVVPLDGGGPSPLAGVGGGVMEPAVSRASHRLAYSVESPSINNWLFDTNDPGGTHVKFAESTQVDGNPNFSADGNKVVFSSDRSGRLAVWSADRKGTNLTRLTEMTIAGTPRWSPDGSEVAFDAPRDGGLEIYAVPSFRGEPRQITTSPENDTVPSYSRDGRWIYFASDRSGEFQIWRVPVAGEQQNPGSARQITQGGGFGAFESPDGRWLYYAKARLDNLSTPNSLWRVPVEGGTEEPVIDELYSNWCNWGLAGNDVYFINPSDGRGWAVYKMDLTTRVVTKIAPIRGSPFLHGPGFDVSQDSRWILYSSYDSFESDLMLVENFR